MHCDIRSFNWGEQTEGTSGGSLQLIMLNKAAIGFLNSLQGGSPKKYNTIKYL